MATTDQNKATVVRFNKEFIEGGSLEAFRQILAPDFVNRTAPPGAPTGPEGVAYFFNQFLKTAFPDLTVAIHDQVAEADKVTTRKSFHATHQGEFFGIPATQRPVVMDVVDIIRLRDGQFVEHWGLVDWQSVMAQLTA
jgi:predicted ester cyclase